MHTLARMNDSNAAVGATNHGKPRVGRLQIAYLTNQYPKVSHSFIRREIRALERQGIEVLRIAVRGWDGDVVDEADKAEKRITRYVLQRGWWPPLAAAARRAVRTPRRFLGAALTVLRLAWRADRPLPYHVAYFLQACLMAEWLEEAGVAHVHAHFGTNPAEVALLACALGEGTYSFTVHGPDEFDRGVYLHLDEKIGRAQFVVAVNSYCRSQLMLRASHKDWPKIKIVHCGLDQSFFEDGVTQATYPLQFVCVGRLCEQKAQLLLLDAFARITETCDCRLVLAGDGDLRAELERRIDALGLRSRVRITGWISEDQVRDEITAARALVLPSFAESLPVVIMEAMALRRPVISTYVAGIPELVIPGNTGWLVPAGSVDALARAMQECIDASGEDIAQMGQAAHRRARERHSIDREASKLVSLFEGKQPTGAVVEWSS